MMRPEDILILEMKRNKAKELLDYLLGHDKHSDSGANRIAWNIKVGCDEGNLSDPKIREENGLKDKWDEKWKEHLKEHFDLFNQCCTDGLDFVGDTNGKHKPMCPWTTKEGDEFDYEIWQSGRSGGWLELHKFEGVEVEADKLEERYEGLCEDEEDYCCKECRGHMVEVQEATRRSAFHTYSKWVRDGCEDPELHTEEYYDDLENTLIGDIDWLEKLVRFCKSLDEFDASKELEYQLAFRRQQLEEEWEEEKKEETQREAIAEERYLYLEF